jgi:hypothetical protein
MTFKLKSITSDYELTEPFTNVLFAFPITGLALIFAPRSIILLFAYCKRRDLRVRRIHSVIRSVTSVFMFGLCMTHLVILTLLYKGASDIVQMSDEDLLFIRSDHMKWGIIVLAVILIVGTMFDLYFSLTVRTYYLVRHFYPDLEERQVNKQGVAKKTPIASKSGVT